MGVLSHALRRLGQDQRRAVDTRVGRPDGLHGRVHDLERQLQERKARQFPDVEARKRWISVVPREQPGRWKPVADTGEYAAYLSVRVLGVPRARSLAQAEWPSGGTAAKSAAELFDLLAEWDAKNYVVCAGTGAGA